LLALFGLVCRPSPINARESGRLAGGIYGGHRHVLPPDRSGLVRAMEQRPWREKNDLNRTLSAQRARRAVAFNPARLGISKGQKETESLGCSPALGK